MGAQLARESEELRLWHGRGGRKDSGRLIGWAGISRPEGAPPEIIYGFEQAAWHSGYGRELLAALVDLARERGVDPVRATVASANVRSIALLIAAGFELTDAAYDGDISTHLYELRG